jgi:hypothetical protein
MEGALVLPVAVVLNRRRQRRIWRGGGVRLRRPAREPSRSGDRSRRRGSEPVLSRPSRDRGRQKLARTVRLPQPMGAGGRRPPEVTPRGWLRAAPVHRRVKAFTVKSRATRRRDPAARTVRPIGENRRPAKDAAQRRKRRAGVRGDRKVEPWTSPGRPGEQAERSCEGDSGNRSRPRAFCPLASPSQPVRAASPRIAPPALAPATTRSISAAR